MQVRPGREGDAGIICSIINDAAEAYRGVIPADRWHEPYMPMDALEREIAEGVRFWVAEEGGAVLGVMGLQDRADVTLVRHAYVSTGLQRKGVGSQLLRHVRAAAAKPVLIGTWADAVWAIGFYQRNGFTLLAEDEKDRLLRAYWNIPARQVETSVVLADERWLQRHAPSS
jgi:N-acetylglutamate synthase-like GNAT family acetyltransferase